MSIDKRKLDHLKICREEDVDRGRNGFEEIDLPYLALPELDFAEISTATEFMGFKIALPLLISSMTGGMQEGAVINKKMAILAQKKGIPLALGSGRIVLEKPETAVSFQVKKYMPDMPLLANLGAVQLNYGWDINKCNQLVEILEADGLILHFNALQEVLQPEGDLNFNGLIGKIGEIVNAAKYPVIVKEVGSGINGQIANKLQEVGVKYIDVAGKGGTNWSLIEGKRRGDLDIGELVATLGISTAECLRQSAHLKDVKLIASGGIKNGIDIAKALWLGATMTGMAKQFLLAENPEKLVDDIQFTLKIAMFSMGKKSIEEIYEKTENN